MQVLFLPSREAVTVTLLSAVVSLLVALTVLPDKVKPPVLPLRDILGVPVSVPTFSPSMYISLTALTVIILVPPAGTITSGEALTVIIQSPVVILPPFCVIVHVLLTPLYVALTVTVLAVELSFTPAVTLFPDRVNPFVLPLREIVGVPVSVELDLPLMYNVLEATEVIILVPPRASSDVGFALTETVQLPYEL